MNFQKSHISHLNFQKQKQNKLKYYYTLLATPIPDCCLLTTLSFQFLPQSQSFFYTTDYFHLHGKERQNKLKAFSYPSSHSKLKVFQITSKTLQDLILLMWPSPLHMDIFHKSADSSFGMTSFPCHTRQCAFYLWTFAHAVPSHSPTHKNIFLNSKAALAGGKGTELGAKTPELQNQV